MWQERNIVPHCLTSVLTTKHILDLIIWQGQEPLGIPSFNEVRDQVAITGWVILPMFKTQPPFLKFQIINNFTSISTACRISDSRNLLPFCYCKFMKCLCKTWYEMIDFFWIWISRFLAQCQVNLNLLFFRNVLEPVVGQSETSQTCFDKYSLVLSCCSIFLLFKWIWPHSPTGSRIPGSLYVLTYSRRLFQGSRWFRWRPDILLGIYFCLLYCSK